MNLTLLSVQHTTNFPFSAIQLQCVSMIFWNLSTPSASTNLFKNVLVPAAGLSPALMIISPIIAFSKIILILTSSDGVWRLFSILTISNSGSFISRMYICIISAGLGTVTAALIISLIRNGPFGSWRFCSIFSAILIRFVFIWPLHEYPVFFNACLTLA